MTTLDLPREAQSGPIFHPDLGTNAFVVWRNSQHELDALLAMVFPVLDETERSERYLAARRLKVERDHLGPWCVDVQGAMLSWQVAMRVSAAELYLQDVLTFLAMLVPEFIKSRDPKQEWDYDSIRIASDRDEALWTFCNRWARGFVSDGGPSRWAKSLKAAGLSDQEPKVVQTLELMWGYRHMRVHHGGLITHEFTRRHGELAEELLNGGLTLEVLRQWTDALTHFICSVERGIEGRVRASLGEELISEREQLEWQRQFAVWDEGYQAIKERETEEQAEARIARSYQESENDRGLIDELFSETKRSGTV